MIIDITRIDQQIAFQHEQAKNVQARNTGAKWANDIAAKYMAIAETLRQLRQEKQMTGVGGKRL